MSKKAHNTVDTELAGGFTISDYEAARDSSPPNRGAIAGAIRQRFTERYIGPVRAFPRHGFTIMAVSCLMIGALESFRQGWEDSDGKSRKAFSAFFNAFEPFREFRDHADAFYTHIRCGILHQAETTGGWRIRRDTSPLLDASACTINAERFLDALEEVLWDFCDQLEEADWSSPEWANVRSKMDAIARNCRST
jgi:hypothetical protein